MCYVNLMVNRITQYNKADRVQLRQIPCLLFTSLVGFSFGDSAMKRINISTKTHPNTFTLVDDTDFEWLSQWKWTAVKLRAGIRAIRKSHNKVLYMHRFITNCPKGLDVDHKNHIGIDNQRHNLRKCTRSQNLQNSRKAKGCSSQFKGVCWSKKSKKWQVALMFNGKLYRLGYFTNETEAGKAYDKKAIELFEEFACLNFPN